MFQYFFYMMFLQLYFFVSTVSHDFNNHFLKWDDESTGFDVMIFPLMNTMIVDLFQENVKTREGGMNAKPQLCWVNAEMSRRNTRRYAEIRVIHAATESKVISGKLSTNGKIQNWQYSFLSHNQITSNQIGTPKVWADVFL